ncbi:MAG: hypothetical protein B7Z15_07285 [Rhizobiales bacterium 32-66-8]|nr:MAG: hypothetical protein B7Z15_07285 [Rhizobiales bacterium 32-66-8]
MTWLWERVVYGVPWALQAGAGVVLAVPLVVLAGRLFGLRRAAALAGVLGVILAAFAQARRARQAGWADRDAKEQRDAQAAIDLARSTRARSAERADGGRLHDDDGWRRD